MLEWHDLNARHAATFLWVTAMLILFAVRSEDVRKSVYKLLTTILKPAILLPLAGLIANVAFLTFIAVIVGRRMGVWETLPVVTASLWAFTTGFSLLLHLGEFLKGDNNFRDRAVAMLGPAAILAAVMGVAICSFWWELVLVPILFVAGAVLVFLVNANRSSGLTIVFSVLLLVYVGGSILPIFKVIIGLDADPETLRSLKQSILLLLVLTIGTLPYIQLLVIVERLRFSKGAKCKMVRSRDYGKDWPLTVDTANLCCRAQAVWVEVNGRKYGVNGTAGGILKMYGYECFDLTDIWRDHPDGEAMGLKVSFHRLIQDGLALEH